MNIHRIIPSPLARLCSATIALALMAGVAGMADAQEKGATRLLRSSGRLIEPKSAPGNHQPMSCARCTDRVVTVKDNLTAKGAGARALLAGGAPTKRVATHQCAGCGNTWVVSGHGKARVSRAVHSCNSCGAETLACCSTTKGGGAATHGMERPSGNPPAR